MRAILAVIIYCFVLINTCEEASAGRRIKRDPVLIRPIQHVYIKSNATKNGNYTEKLYNNGSLQNITLNGNRFIVANFTSGLKEDKLSVADRNATQSVSGPTAGYKKKTKPNTTAKINLKASVSESIPFFEREFLLDDKPSTLDNVAAGIWLLDNNIDIKYPINSNTKQNEFDNRNRGGGTLFKKLTLPFQSNEKEQQQLNEYKPCKNHNNINAYKEIITADDEDMNAGFGDFDLMPPPPPIVNRNNHRFMNFKPHNRNLVAETAAMFSPMNLLWHTIDQQQQKRENNRNVDDFERNLQEIDAILSSPHQQQKADGGDDPTRKLANLIFNKILSENDMMPHKREEIAHNSKYRLNQRMLPYNAYENNNNFDYIFDVITTGDHGDFGNLKQTFDETPSKHTDLLSANNKQTITGKDTIQTLNLLENALELVLSADNIVESNNKRTTQQCPLHQHNNEHKINDTKSNICVQMDIDDEKNGNTIQVCTCHVVDK